MPVFDSKGCRTDWKSCCSVPVHSAHSDTEPPMCCSPAPVVAVDALVGDELPPHAAAPRLTAARSAPALHALTTGLALLMLRYPPGDGQGARPLFGTPPDRCQCLADRAWREASP